MTTSAHRGSTDFINALPICLFWGVGNGGLSLRRTRTALRVLRSFSYIWKPRELLHGPASAPIELVNVLTWEFREKNRRCDSLRTALRNLVFGNNTFYPLNDFSVHEDLFWGLIAARNFSWFKVAPVEEARKFSIEGNPRQLFALNRNQLPFGCHAWSKHDREFWAPYITRYIKLPEHCG